MKKMNFSFPSETVQEDSQFAGSTYFNEIANLPEKKGIGAEIQPWETFTKIGPNKTEIQFKVVELDTTKQEYAKESEPKLKIFITIDDLKLRAGMLAFSKYKYEKNLKKLKKANKFLLFVLSLRK